MNTVAAVRLKVIRQIFGRAIAALALIGVWALLGHTVNVLLAVAAYGVVAIVHALYVCATVGGIRIPLAVPTAAEKAPVGFQVATPAPSSAEAVRRSQTQ